MTVTINPDTTAALEVTVTGDLDLRAAADVIDVLARTAPEPAVIVVGEVNHVTAEGIAHLVGAARRHRRRGREVVIDAVGAPALVELLFALAGVTDLQVERQLVGAAA